MWAIILSIAIIVACIIGLIANSTIGFWLGSSNIYWQNVWTCIFTAVLIIPFSILVAPYIGDAIRSQTTDAVATLINRLEDEAEEHPDNLKGPERWMYFEKRILEALQPDFDCKRAGPRSPYDLEITTRDAGRALVEVKSFKSPVSKETVIVVDEKMREADPQAGRLLVSTSRFTESALHEAARRKLRLHTWTERNSPDQEIPRLRAAVKVALTDSKS